MMNDYHKRVQVGREKDVPLKNVWYLFVKEDGSWDAGQGNDDDFVNHVKDEKTKHIFAIWHGQWRTNLFLMEKKNLFKKLKKEGYCAFQD